MGDQHTVIVCRRCKSSFSWGGRAKEMCPNCLKWNSTKKLFKQAQAQEATATKAAAEERSARLRARAAGFTSVAQQEDARKARQAVAKQAIARKNDNVVGTFKAMWVLFLVAVWLGAGFWTAADPCSGFAAFGVAMLLTAVSKGAAGLLMGK